MSPRDPNAVCRMCWWPARVCTCYDGISGFFWRLRWRVWYTLLPYHYHWWRHPVLWLRDKRAGAL